MNRTELWAKVVALYAAYWPGRPILTTPTVSLMEQAGIDKHAPEVVLQAVRIAGTTSKHPPSVAELLELLEGETRRVPIHVTDLYGAVRLGTDGAPIVKGWTTERTEPRAYAAIRVAQGLPAPAMKALAYRPPVNLDRPESDGEPRPALPAELLQRAAIGSPGSDRAPGVPERRPEAKAAPARANAAWRASDGCPACGYRGNQAGENRCRHCARPLPGSAT